MKDIFKRLFCSHRYIKTKTIKSKRENNDNLVITDSHYECVKCSKYFTVQDNVVIEKDYYIEWEKEVKNALNQQSAN